MRALALKYRPQTFGDVVEQGATIHILQEQLSTSSHQNCYLFTGGAGTGKTTCARIFANDINKGQGNPIEIDAASNNGVDNVRDIINDAKFKALDSPYKVYIIDECHMLSNGAWNAMLKLIEEPPAQTIFIFCTTDPQKIPPTIISRVQRHNFQRITYDAVIARLAHIIGLENDSDEIKADGLQIEYQDEALSYIAKIADGGMRDAITLMDKCLSYSEELTIKNVTDALGIVDYTVMFNLTEAIIAKDLQGVITIIEDAHRAGVDLKQFIKQYSYFVLDAYKYYLLGNFEYLQIPSMYEPQLDKWVDEDYEFIHYLLGKVVNLNAAVKWEASPKPLIEATLILLGAEAGGE